VTNSMYASATVVVVRERPPASVTVRSTFDGSPMPLSKSSVILGVRRQSIQKSSTVLNLYSGRGRSFQSPSPCEAKEQWRRRKREAAWLARSGADPRPRHKPCHDYLPPAFRTCRWSFLRSSQMVHWR
jgi:hypothetical protein